jgi:hypothetical protein
MPTFWIKTQFVAELLLDASPRNPSVNGEVKTFCAQKFTAKNAINKNNNCRFI